MAVAVSAISEEQQVITTQVQIHRAEFAQTTARILKWGIGVSSVGVVIVWLFFRSYSQLLILSALLLAVVAGTMLYSVIEQQRRTSYRVFLFLGPIMLLALIAPLLIPAVMSAVPIAYFVILLLAYLILGKTGGGATVGACVVCYAANLVLTNVAPQWFPPLGETLGSLAGGVLSLIGFLVAAGILGRISIGQEGDFRQVQQAKLTIEKRAAAEENQRRHLQTTVEQYVAFMAQVAMGNLSARLPLAASAQDSDDPLVLLGNNLNETVASLQQMTAQVRETAANLGSASAEILTATAQQASATSEQSASVTQASVTIQEVRASAEQAAQIAQGVAELVQHTAQVAQAGQEAVAGTIAGMQEVKQTVEVISQNILTLSGQAQAIGQIITTVNEIAAQSNMLALNAAVEAARAGGAGKGFAVVAGEVRSLAEQSRGATVQVKEILSQIQRGVKTVVVATEEGMRKVDAGTRVASDAGEAIEKLSASVHESRQAAVQIAAAASQQLVGVTQISQAMQSIDQATAQNVAGARQVERAAADLNDLAGALRGLIERYGV